MLSPLLYLPSLSPCLVLFLSGEPTILTKISISEAGFWPSKASKWPWSVFAGRPPGAQILGFTSFPHAQIVGVSRLKTSYVSLNKTLVCVCVRACIHPCVWMHATEQRACTYPHGQLLKANHHTTSLTENQASRPCESSCPKAEKYI